MRRVEWSRSAAKFYEGLRQAEKDRVDAALGEIQEDPIGARNVKPLKGELKGCYRRRIGDLRMIYEFSATLIYIKVLDNRGSAYRR